MSHLQSSVEGRTIPFAFITSECTTEMKDQANEVGAVAFLTKPFTPETMESALGKLLG